MSRSPKCHTCGLFVPLPPDFSCTIAACTNSLLSAAHAVANQRVRRRRNEKRARQRGYEPRRNPVRAKAYQAAYYLAHKDMYRKSDRRRKAKLSVRVAASARWRERYRKDAEFRAHHCALAQAYRARKGAAGMIFARQPDGSRRWVYGVRTAILDARACAAERKKGEGLRT